jgi:hypothetical protein
MDLIVSATKDKTPHFLFTADRTSYKETAQVITLRSYTRRALDQIPSTGDPQTLCCPNAVLRGPRVQQILIFCFWWFTAASFKFFGNFYLNTVVKSWLYVPSVF